MKTGVKVFRWLLVIIFIAELAFSGWYFWWKKNQQDKRDKIFKATSDLRLLENAILEFKKKYGALPLTLAYLKQGENPILKSLPDDPFPSRTSDQDTYYYCTSQDGHYLLYSCGPNNINDCDIDDYEEASRISRSLGSGEAPEDCDDIIVSDLPIKNR